MIPYLAAALVLGIGAALAVAMFTPLEASLSYGRRLRAREPRGLRAIAADRAWHAAMIVRAGHD